MGSSAPGASAGSGEAMNAEDDEQDEAALFRQAMAGVQPLKSRARIPPGRSSPRARARFARAERAAVLRESLTEGTDLYEVQPGDELRFRRPGVPETVLRSLRRGLYRVKSETDLHGLNASDAAAHLAQFLRAARARDLRCVRIIHGKGLRSGA